MTHPIPRNSRLEQLRHRFLRTPLDIAVTAASLLLALFVGWKLLDWAVLSAVWTSPDGLSQPCRDASGACWAVIEARWRLILFGVFPYAEQWRAAVATAALILAGGLSCLPLFWSVIRQALLWIAAFALFMVFMHGGVFGLSSVPPAQWGGLALTLFFFVAVVIVGMPLSICLALMRRSDLPVIRGTAIILIDGVRALPLVTILFTAALILPFVLPGWLQGDKIWRVIAGFALFFAAYQAEVLRSGIQALPRGQEEAAKALGMGYFHRITRVVLPQAFRNALPPTINQLVITLMETSLIVIIGFFDLMASGNAAYGTGEWSFAYVEVYAFIALIYGVFVFSLSRYGRYLERRLRVGSS
ncbi:amino acid ABC transporter permease [Frigidibacter sp.]|uniref:amino acid ABC transporter permease n=1 Tax=Frigidibacter sp. TaxID=2586418 RepID=UPI0027361FC8|nr:amino acid ABC transporter permease [Frigidibacter sp.]